MSVCVHARFFNARLFIFIVFYFRFAYKLKMSINVEEILRKAEEEKEKALESVSVEKSVDLFIDLAHLAAFDPNIIDAKEFK